MLTSLKAGDVMTAPVHCVGSEMDLIRTTTFLAEKGVSGAPVVNSEGKIVGVVSEKDFLAKMGAKKTGSFMQVITQVCGNAGGFGGGSNAADRACHQQYP
jgi:CBS domain-containing membrane protein